MHYRNNDLSFVIIKKLITGYRADYTVGGVSFTVNEFYVSKGQDLEGRLSAREYSGKKNKLTFELGRKGTTETAKWFNGKIKSEQTTFGHTAKKLNFAMIGTLELTIQNTKQFKQATYSFPDVMLAQGHSGATNNWWFGSLHAKKSLASHSIDCEGTDASGHKCTFTFRRGSEALSSQSVDEVEIDFLEKDINI